MNPKGNLHHAQDRMLTVMEMKRIQSIPDDVHISVSPHDAHNPHLHI